MSFDPCMLGSLLVGRLRTLEWLTVRCYYLDNKNRMSYATAPPCKGKNCRAKSCGVNAGVTGPEKKKANPKIGLFP